MRLCPLRHAVCALVVALVTFTSGGATASEQCSAAGFAPTNDAEIAPIDDAPGEPDGGMTVDPPLVSELPATGEAPPVLIPSDDACDPAYQVEAGPAMCTTDGASAVAPRVIHPPAAATLDAPQPCGPELGLGTTVDRDQQPHERPPSVALDACLFTTPSLPSPPLARTVPSLRPRDDAGRDDARRLDRPPRG